MLVGEEQKTCLIQALSEIIPHHRVSLEGGELKVSLASKDATEEEEFLLRHQTVIHFRSFASGTERLSNGRVTKKTLCTTRALSGLCCAKWPQQYPDTKGNTYYLAVLSHVERG